MVYWRHGNAPFTDKLYIPTPHPEFISLPRLLDVITMHSTQPPADFDTYLSNLKSNLNEPRRFAIAREHALTPKTVSEERLSRVTAPTLVVMGTKDSDWPDPVAEAEFMVEALSGELALIEDADHYPQTEMPEKTIPAILDFLDRVNDF